MLEKEERLRITAMHASLDALAVAVQRGEVEKPDVVELLRMLVHRRCG